MCAFFFMLNFLFPVPLSLHSSLLFCLSLKAFDEKRINLAKRSAAGLSIEAISLLTLIYWQRINEHECMSVCACVSICVHTLRQGLTALCVFVCVCSPTVQSVLRESQVICESKEKQIAELKKMSDQSADSLKNEWEKKVRGKVEGLGYSAAQPPVSSPEPEEDSLIAWD